MILSTNNAVQIELLAIFRDCLCRGGSIVSGEDSRFSEVLLSDIVLQRNDQHHYFLLDENTANKSKLAKIEGGHRGLSNIKWTIHY